MSTEDDGTGPRGLVPQPRGLLLLPLAALAVVFAQRAVEVIAGVLILLAALRPAAEIVTGRPDSPLGRWGAAWVAVLFWLVGSSLIVWGFRTTTFLAAGYAS